MSVGALDDRALRLFLDQICELIEEVRCIMGTGRSFGMILHAEYRQFLVPHSLHGAVVQIYVCYFHIRRQRFRIDGKPVILRRDCHFTIAQIFYWLVRAMMAKFQFVGRTSECEPKNLMAEANSENRFLAHQIARCLVRIRQGLRDRPGHWREKCHPDLARALLRRLCSLAQP